MHFIYPSYAGPNEESFNADMDKWQRAYPVLAQVREDEIFKDISKGALAGAKSGTTVDVMKVVLPAFTRYIFESGLYSLDSDTYFPMIEFLDPVTRDLLGLDQQTPILPVLEQCEPLYIVHSIFHDGEKMIDESSRKDSAPLQGKENTGLNLPAAKAGSPSPSKQQVFSPAKGNEQGAAAPKQLAY